MLSHHPRFSIVMVDYENSVNRDHMRRAIDSIAKQSCQEFELLLYHDGPKKVPYEQELSSTQLSLATHIYISEKRHNNWGHTLRDQGIRKAKGDYIIHLNADNLMYPDMLERLAVHADSHLETLYDHHGNIKNGNDILIFCIQMRGVIFYNGGYTRRIGEEDKYSVIMTGIPTKFRNIDCMQLVMKRELWLAEGGWHDKSRNSDGNMYPHFVEKYGARYIPEILGEHW